MYYNICPRTFSFINRLALATAALFFLGSNTGFAQEESLDLDAEVAAPAPSKSTTAPKFSIMGRVDLTSETTQPDDTDGNSTQNLDNKHFFLFLKVNASAKTSFMGEFVAQEFFYVDYKASNLLDVQFGKILVPFGDTRRFHHYYGGVNDGMFPLIWSSHGANVAWHFGSVELDTYLVNTFAASTDVSTPTLASSTTERQAAGLRLTTPLFTNLTGILSVYAGEYWPGRTALLSGLDIYSEYKPFGLSFLKNLRFAFGFANANFAEAPGGQFDRTGDFVEFISNLVGPGEMHLRYGTYVDEDNTLAVESENDTHTFALGYRMSVDVIRVLVEHEWNFEEVNEVDNDIFRVMASLDF